MPPSFYAWLHPVLHRSFRNAFSLYLPELGRAIASQIKSEQNIAYVNIGGLQITWMQNVNISESLDKQKPCVIKKEGIKLHESGQWRSTVRSLKNTLFWGIPMFSQIQKVTLSSASESHPCLFLTCPYTPATLEGGSTISQFSNVTASKSCTVKGHSQYDECKTKETINSLSTVIFEDVWVRLLFVVREQSGPHQRSSCSLSSLREEKTKPQGSLCPSLLLTVGSKTVKDVATSLTQTAVFISSVSSHLDWRTS